MPEFTASALAEWCGGCWRGGEPTAVIGVTNDSRVVRQGELYVAIRGERFDGHTFLSDAATRSAAAALVDEQHASAQVPVMPELIVPDTRKALIDLARGHRARCHGIFVGITGSIGKTTVKEMTADVLSHIGSVQRTWLNWNNDIGLPLCLLRTEPADRFGVFEVGMSHPGELRPLCDLLHPAWGILTPIGAAHLENFDSIDAIAEEKACLLDALPEDGVCVLSLDDPRYPLLLKHVRSRVVRVSLQNPEADYHGTWCSGMRDTLTVSERQNKIRHEYPLPLPGRYVADNALRAIAVGREWGIAPETIADILLGFKPLPMRWQEESVRGVHFINDAYNANPDSMLAAIEVLKDRTVTGRKWLVLGGMRELGVTELDAHKAIGRRISSYPWAGVLTVGERGAWIAAGAEEEGIDSSVYLLSCANATEVAAVLNEQTLPGDLILLKASRGERLEEVIHNFKEF